MDTNHTKGNGSPRRNGPVAAPGDQSNGGVSGHAQPTSPTADIQGLMIDNRKMEIIPEPAAYAAWLGGALIGFMLFRRLRR